MSADDYKTLNPIPRCEVCGRETSRVQTTAGKGRYKCVNVDCRNYMKAGYVRGSRKNPDDARVPSE